MPPTAPPRPPGFSRRTLLAASAMGLALLSAGCTASPADEQEEVTSAQADELSTQVAVQEALVAAYASAGTADPVLASAVTELATQAADQLNRLRAAVPGLSASPAPPSATPPDATEARAWLRAEVSAASASHAAACLEQSGARAALLGSIAAGLRGQDGQLA